MRLNGLFLAWLFSPRTVFLRYWCFLLIALVIHGVGSQGTAAYAQSEEVPVSPPSPSVNTATRLEEITVTAQRREESAQDAPISMRVFSAEELQDSNARRTTDLFEATPNMNFTSADSGVAGANIFLRGVGAVVVQNVEQGDSIASCSTLGEP